MPFRSIFFLIFALLSSSDSALAGRGGGNPYYKFQSPYLDDRFQCVFKNAIHLGASITHETMRNSGPAALAPYFLAKSGATFGESPAKLLTKYYSRGNIAANLSATYGYPVGFQQIDTILRKQPGLLDDASAVIGIDLFYWDAAWEYCDHTIPRINALIQNLRHRKIPLILGTVPLENPELVTWNYLGSLREYIWTPPEANCVRKINSLLQSNCKADRGCFLLDLHGIIENLNSTGSLQMRNGRKFSLTQVRPDGVHVSSYGSEFLVQEIIKSLQQSPHLCRKGN